MDITTHEHIFRNSVPVCSYVYFGKLWEDKPQTIYSGSLQEKGWDLGWSKEWNFDYLLDLVLRLIFISTYHFFN